MTSDAASLASGSRGRSFWSILVRLAPPVILIGLLWSVADGSNALALLVNADWRYLAAAFVAVNLQTILSAIRWHRVCARLGLTIPPGHAIGEYYLSQVVNQSLPGGVLGDAARATRARHEAGLALAAKAVVIERLAGQIAMFGLLTIAGSWAILTPGGLALPMQQNQMMVGLLLIAALAFALVLIVFVIRKRWSAQLGASLKRALLDNGAWVEQLGLSLAIVALNLASFSLCALATGTVLGFEATLVLVPLILCAMLVPTTIAGWGFREGAAAALFPIAGATAAAGFAASVAFGLVILAASLPGLIVLFRSTKTRSSS